MFNICKFRQKDRQRNLYTNTIYIIYNTYVYMYYKYV